MSLPEFNKNFILCEFAWQIDATINSPELRKAQIIALTPECAWRCQIIGKDYRKLEDYYDQERLWLQHDRMFAEEVRWFEWVDSYLRGAVSEFRQTEFRPARGCALMLQPVFDECYAGAYILRSFLEKAGKCELLYWPADLGPLREDVQHTQPHCSIYPVLVSEMATSCESRSVALTSPTGISPPADTGRGKWKPAARRALGDRLFGELRYLQGVGLARYVHSQLRPKKDSRVLAVGGGYDLTCMVWALRERGVRVDWQTDLIFGEGKRDEFVNQDIIGAMEASWKEVCELDEFWSPLDVAGVGRNPMIKSLLAHWWLRVVPEYWQGYCNTLRKLSGQDYIAIVTWDATPNAAALQAAQSSGIHSVIFQHGSTARVSGHIWYSYLANADALLVYGAGTAEQLQGTWPGSAKATLDVVGSTRLDAIRAAMTPTRVAKIRTRMAGREKRRIVLYAPMYFGRYGRALGDAAYYPDVSYFEMQCRIMQLFAQYPRVCLLYKDLSIANGLRNPIPEFIRQYVPNGRVVDAPPPLWKMFWGVDAIIIDHVITALGEALLTRKPLLVYAPGSVEAIPELPDARVLLRRRASVAETPDQFLETIRLFLDANDFSELADADDGFLRSYCTHLNDGQSAQRAAAAVICPSGNSSRSSRVLPARSSAIGEGTDRTTASALRL